MRLPWMKCLNCMSERYVGENYIHICLGDE